MSMSREEQLKILDQMKDSDIDYSDVPATDNLSIFQIFIKKFL
jgi:hypothetical protein